MARVIDQSGKGRRRRASRVPHSYAPAAASDDEPHGLRDRLDARVAVRVVRLVLRGISGVAHVHRDKPATLRDAEGPQQLSTPRLIFVRQAEYRCAIRPERRVNLNWQLGSKVAPPGASDTPSQ